MKKLLFSLALMFVSWAMLAQQEHQYTQFMYNKLLINPAYAGARGVPSVTAIYRNQWIGFDGAPQSFLASFNSPFLSPRVGVGVTLSHNKIGLQRDFFGNIAYSYDLIAKEDVSLRMGVMGSLRSLGIDFSKSQAYQPNDPSVLNQRANDIYGNVGAGLYGTFMQKVYVGFSIPRIYSNVIGVNPGANLPTAKEYRHMYGMAGAILPLSKDINLMPAVLVKYVQNAPVSTDINVNLDIRQKVTAGISYRLGGDGPGESVDLLVLWQIHEQFGVGAAYDFTLSNIKDYSAGSIEVMAQYDLRNKNASKKKKMTNPRFFM
jgi:type IX secretion system PorP/SprF family membrane protein